MQRTAVSVVSGIPFTEVAETLRLSQRTRLARVLFGGRHRESVVSLALYPLRMWNQRPTTIPVADIVGVPGTGHVTRDVEETTLADVLDGLTTLRVSRNRDVFVGSTH